MDKDYLAVRASYLRCCASRGFFDTFYDTFLAKSPEVAEKFVNTDFAKQKQILKGSIFHMVLDAEDNERAHREIEQIAESHSRRHRDISPALYALWLDSLCEAIKQHDPGHTAELEALWRAKMSAVIEQIVAKY